MVQYNIQNENNVNPNINQSVKIDETHRPMNHNQVSNDDAAMPIYMENQVNNGFNMNVPVNNLSTYNMPNLQGNSENINYNNYNNQAQYYGNFNQPQSNQNINNNVKVPDSNAYVSGNYSSNQPKINQEQKNLDDLPGIEDVQNSGGPQESNQNQMNQMNQQNK